MVFYATAEGVVFEPLSTEAKRCEHDGKKARDRLSAKIAKRRINEEKERLASRTAAKESRFTGTTATEVNHHHGNNSATSEENRVTSKTYSTKTEIQRIEEQLQRSEIRSNQIKKERDNNKFLADNAKFAKKGDSKAIPSNYVYQPSPADNAEKRAIVHHTGSHYHMAGSKQFQRGIRVKGVISRHSKQGAKMQAARMSRRNMLAAREDARGERATGGGKDSKGFTKVKRKKKNLGAEK